MGKRNAGFKTHETGNISSFNQVDTKAVSQKTVCKYFRSQTPFHDGVVCKDCHGKTTH